MADFKKALTYGAGVIALLLALTAGDRLASNYVTSQVNASLAGNDQSVGAVLQNLITNLVSIPKK